MALVGNETLKSVRGSLVRSLRYLKQDIEKINESLNIPERNGAGPPNAEQTDLLRQRVAVLQKSYDEFHQLLCQFERKAANLDDVSYQQEQEDWGDADHDSQVLLVRAEQTIEKEQERLNQNNPNHNQPQVPGAAQGPPNENLNANFDRLLTLLENQQLAPPVAPAAPAVAPQPGQHTQARLPKLELPKFSGDLLKWKPFIDRFEASVDKNEKLAPVDKLSYLISLLEGVPLKMVQALPVINENYPVALKMLKEKYGDKKMVVAMLYRQLNEMKTVKTDVVSLRRFVADIDCLLGSLGALGQDTTDDHFATLILSKLPNPVVVQLELSKPVNDPWSVALVREKLAEYLTRLERASKVSALRPQVEDDSYDHTGDSFFANDGKQSKGKKKHGDKNGKAGYSQNGRETPRGGLHWGQSNRSRGNSGPGYQNGPRGRYTGMSGKSRPFQMDRLQDANHRFKKCAFCVGPHWSDHCEKFKTADERHAQLGGRCSNCLGENHRRRECKSDKPCFYCRKAGSHHSSLCYERFGRLAPENTHLGADRDLSRNEDDSSDSDEEQHRSIGVGENGLLACGEEVRLQTALVPISADDHSCYIKKRTLMDPGCNRSYGSHELKRQLGLKTKPGPTLQINRFGSSKPVQVKTEVAKLKIKALNGKTRVIEVSIIPHISGSLSRVPVKSKNLENLKLRLTLADTTTSHRETSPIDLLIGSDYYLDFITGEKIEVEKGLYQPGSECGYLLTGRTKTCKSEQNDMSMVGFTGGTLDALADLEPIPKSDPVQFQKPDTSDFWSLENIGITDDPAQCDDQKAIEDFKENVCMKNGRYSVSLPWNDNVSELQADYGFSFGRLKSLVNRIGDNDQLWTNYAEIIDDQWKKGVIEKVEESPLHSGNPVHYIPHHAVVQPQRETTKVRVVYDGSAKSQQKKSSLNECLYRGPIILKDLVGILLRFRLFPVALMADIEKAFLQIGINDVDRDRVRFLWLKNPTVKNLEHNIQVYRFARVLFGLNCSPSLLAQVIQHHLQKIGTAAASKIQENLYVDNVFSGVDSSADAKKFNTDSKRIFESASMNLRCWASNSQDFMNTIPDKDKVQSTTVKVLGVKWNIEKDTVVVAGPDMDRINSATTKREILSCISSVFDPLGWFAPCTIPSKCVLQEVSRDKQSWDAKVTSLMSEKWKESGENLAGIQKIEIPRRIFAAGGLMLAAFCDASGTSFATTMYLNLQ